MSSPSRPKPQIRHRRRRRTSRKKYKLGEELHLSGIELWSPFQEQLAAIGSQCRLGPRIQHRSYAAGARPFIWECPSARVRTPWPRCCGGRNHRAPERSPPIDVRRGCQGTSRGYLPVEAKRGPLAVPVCLLIRRFPEQPYESNSKLKLQERRRFTADSWAWAAQHIVLVALASLIPFYDTLVAAD